jgi:hypothetical protein
LLLVLLLHDGEEFVTFLLLLHAGAVLVVD